MTDRSDAAFAALPPPPPMAAELAAAVAGVRPTGTRKPRLRFAIYLLLAGGCALTSVLVLHLRADLGELPMIWTLGVAAGWALASAAALSAVLIPPRGSVMPNVPRAIRVACATSLAFVVLGLLVHPSGPSSLFYGWQRLLQGRGCLELGLAIAIAPVAVGAWSARGSAPVRARWIAAAIGAGGGCIGGLVLHLFCKIADGPHIGVMHGGVVGCAAVISALVIPRAIAPRA